MALARPLSWREFLSAVGHRWKIIVVCALAGALLGVIVASQTKSYFQVSASLQAIEESQVGDVVANGTAAELSADGSQHISIYTVPSNHFIYVTSQADTAEQARSDAYNAALLIADRMRSLYPDTGLQVNGTGGLEFHELSSTEGAVRGAIWGVFIAVCVSVFIALWPRENPREPFEGFILEAFCRRIVRYWPVCAAFVAAGVLVGWMVGYLPAEVFRSRAYVVTATMDEALFEMDEDPAVVSAFDELTEGGGSLWIDSDLISHSFDIKATDAGVYPAVNLAKDAATAVQRAVTARYPDIRSIVLPSNSASPAWPDPAERLWAGCGVGVFCALLFTATRRPEAGHRNLRFRASETSFGTLRTREGN